MTSPKLGFGSALASLVASLSVLIGTAAFPAFAGEKEQIQEALDEANRCQEAMDQLNNPNVALCHPQKGEKPKILPVRSNYEINYPSCKPSKSPLFASDSVLEITVRGYKYDDPNFIFGAFRKPAQENKNPIAVEYALDGKKMTLQAGSEPRGKSRQLKCKFKPLRIILDKKADRSGTLIDHLRGDELKLTDHCTYTSGKITDHPEENQDVLKEYFQYKALKAAGYITPEVRLAKVNYVDKNGAFVTEGYGFFIEPKSDLAHRCGSKHLSEKDREILQKKFTEMNQANYIPFLFAEELVQGWDWIPESAHNTIPLTQDGKIVALAPYDFNDSLLVAARGGVGPRPIPGTKTPEAWLQKLLNGPYSREGWVKGKFLDDEDKLAWREAMVREAKRTLAHKEELMKALEDSPVADKAKFKLHYENLFSTLQKFVETPQ
jgi:hypothetical protein